MAPAPVESAGRARSDERATAVVRHPLTLWIAFLLVHLVLGYLCLHADGLPLGDVTLVYKPWALQAETGMAIVGLDVPWVYPPLALVPIMLPLLVGAAQYAGGWLTMVLLADAAAFAVLTVRRGHRAIAAAWWWLAFLLVLGPIAIARLDAISVAIVIVALLWLRSRPRAAAVLLAVATWIKVWPAAIIASVFVVSRDRWRMLLAVFASSLVVVVLGLTFGNGMNLFSFVTQQTGRGLQIEAPVSMPWMWAAALHAPDTSIYYDRVLLTFQVAGPNIDTAIALMTPLLGIAVMVVLLIGIRATYRGAPALSVLPALTLALTTALIAFNKVGSPQYIAWLAAPVILGIVCTGRRFRTPAVLVGVTAALTQLMYPYLYIWLLNANMSLVLVLTIRNAMLFVVLGWALWALWRSAGVIEEPPAVLDETAAGDEPAREGATVDGDIVREREAGAPTALPGNSGWPFAASDDRKD
jgi:hypothetical protein